MAQRTLERLVIAAEELEALKLDARFEEQEHIDAVLLLLEAQQREVSFSLLKKDPSQTMQREHNEAIDADMDDLFKALQTLKPYGLEALKGAIRAFINTHVQSRMSFEEFKELMKSSNNNLMPGFRSIAMGSPAILVYSIVQKGAYDIAVLDDAKKMVRFE